MGASRPGGGGARPLRCITYLVPSIPLGYFEHVGAVLAGALGRAADLHEEPRFSGPMFREVDPFAPDVAADEGMDVGFVCGASFLWLRAQRPCTVHLLPAAAVPADPRNGGKPVYFADVIVHRDSPARSLTGLRGAVWCYNDAASLSGTFSALQALHAAGLDKSHFRRWQHSGSHLASISAVAERPDRAAAIDSVVLVPALARSPELRRRIRVIASWGPFPVPPIVVHARLGAAERARMAEALRALGSTAAGRETLAPWGVAGFAPIDEAAYAEERAALEALPAAWLRRVGDEEAGEVAAVR